MSRQVGHGAARLGWPWNGLAGSGAAGMAKKDGKAGEPRISGTN